ncbi:anthrone oxygenase family protein [Streptomyces sp. NPDC057287]|uniref:anthrone oxygenase family protein n=1 Tax=Streptomyces sp. NPDC057287 TaxID=3346086 RepID=UPI00363D5095
MQDALAVITVVVVGVMVGVEFAVAVFVNPILDRLPDDGALAARGAGARVLGRVMPFWYIGSMTLGAVWVVMARGDDGLPFVVTGALLLVVSVMMSAVLLVPVGSRVAARPQGGAPEDRKERVGRRDRLHHVRVGVIVLASTLFAVALTR